LGPLPAQGLGERGPGHVARVAVADRVGARNELHVRPVEAGVVEGGPRRHQPVLDEVLAPLAPRVHAHPEDGDLARCHQTALHFHTTCSPSSSSNRVDSTTSTSLPTRSSDASPSTWPTPT